MALREHICNNYAVEVEANQVYKCPCTCVVWVCFLAELRAAQARGNVSRGTPCWQACSHTWTADHRG